MGQVVGQQGEDVAAAAAAIARSAFFGVLPAETLASLAAKAERVEAVAGSVLVRQGEESNCYYLIASGEVEVWSTRGLAPGEPAPEDRATPWQPNHLRHILLERLGPGDGFGEMGLLLGGHSRATVRAASDVVLYKVTAAGFAAAVRSYRGLAVAVEEELALRSAGDFLGKPSPFSQLPRDALRLMAARAQKVLLPAGEEIVRQGESADAFYLIVRGRVAVVMSQPGAAEHRVATLGPGDPCGQMELLVDERSTATLRALEDVEALRLGKDDFRRLLAQHRDRKKYFVRLVLRREPLARNPDWAMEPQEGPEGQVLDILLDARNDRYIVLPPRAVFLWELIDGRRSVRELALAYLARFQSNDLDEIVDLVLQLHAAGAVDIKPNAQAAAPQAAGQSGATARSESSPSPAIYFSLPGPDKVATFLHRFLLRPLFSLPAQAIMLVATILGAAVFLVQVAIGAALPAAGLEAWAIVAGTLLGLLIHGLLHELAHAVTCKHFGCPVPRAGAGWYRFLPVAYVDTSNAWLASPGARAAIHAAGPYCNALVAGLCILAIPVVENPATRTALFCFAVVGYLFVVANLNPFTASDAYNALADRFLVFDLRAQALAFVRSVLWGETLATDAAGHVRGYAAYATLVLVFAATLAGLALIVYHGYAASPLQRALPGPAASAIAWLCPLAVLWVVLRHALRGLGPEKRGDPPAAAATPDGVVAV